MKTADALYNLGGLHLAAKEYAKAEPLLRQCLSGDGLFSERKALPWR